MDKLTNSFVFKRGFFTPKEEVLWESLSQEVRQYWITYDVHNNPDPLDFHNGLMEHWSGLHQTHESFKTSLNRLTQIKIEYEQGVPLFLAMSFSFSLLLFYREGHWLAEGIGHFISATSCLLMSLIFISLQRSVRQEINRLEQTSVLPKDLEFMSWKELYPLISEIGFDHQTFYLVLDELPYSDESIEFLDRFLKKLPTLKKHQNLHEEIDRLIQP